jgi:hypothetical protein
MLLAVTLRWRRLAQPVAGGVPDDVVREQRRRRRRG